MAGYPGYGKWGGDVEMGRPPPVAAGVAPMAYVPQQPGPGGTYAPPSMQTRPAPPVPQGATAGGARPGGGRPPPPPNAVAAASAAARRGFIRKVYSVLFLQLLLTFGVVSVFAFVPDVKFWVLEYATVQWFMPTMIGLAFGSMVILVCCGNVARQHPQNIIFLFIFTAFESLALGSIAATYACNNKTIGTGPESFYQCSNADYIQGKFSNCALNRDMCNTDSGGSLTGDQIVLIALGATLALVLSLTLFAFQTKFDFTGAAPYIFATVMLFAVFGLIAGIWLWKYWTFNIIYAALAVLLFSFILIFDTQKIVGGKHKRYQYSLDDYVFAALSLYIDMCVPGLPYPPPPSLPFPRASIRGD